MKPSDQDFEQRIKTSLENSVTHLDGETRQLFAAMRDAAFAKKSWLPHWLTFENWMPATALAVFSAVVIATLLITSTSEHPQQLALQDADVAMELLLGDSDGEQDELDDPAFYVWLDEALLDEETLNDAT